MEEEETLVDRSLETCPRRSSLLGNKRDSDLDVLILVGNSSGFLSTGGSGPFALTL